MREVRTAGLARRSVSVLADAAVGLLVVVGLLAVGALDASPLRPDPDWFWTEWWLRHWLEDPQIFFEPIIVLVVATLAWVVGWEVATGRTPGDRLARISVVDADGYEPTSSRLVARGLGALINVATLGLGWLICFVSPSRRALHDVISGTWVIVED